MLLRFWDIRHILIVLDRYILKLFWFCDSLHSSHFNCWLSCLFLVCFKNLFCIVLFFSFSFDIDSFCSCHLRLWTHGISYVFFFFNEFVSMDPFFLHCTWVSLFNENIWYCCRFHLMVNKSLVATFDPYLFHPRHLQHADIFCIEFSPKLLTWSQEVIVVYSLTQSSFEWESIFLMLQSLSWMNSWSILTSLRLGF